MSRRFGLPLALIVSITALAVLVDLPGAGLAGGARAQNTAATSSTSGPDSQEIPPPIKTAMKPLPGVAALPHAGHARRADHERWKRVTGKAQWAKRREELKRILEYYAVGLAPPHRET